MPALSKCLPPPRFHPPPSPRITTKGFARGWAAKTVKGPPQPPAQPPVRQLLGTADAERTPAERITRREEGVTVQGPIKKQQPDGMSHKGGGGGQMRVVPQRRGPVRTVSCGPVRVRSAEDFIVLSKRSIVL